MDHACRIATSMGVAFLAPSTPAGAQTSSWLPALRSPDAFQDLKLAIVLSLIYWLVMVVVRWNRVAMPSRFVLRAQIASIEAERQTLAQAAAAPPQAIQAAELLQAARNLIDGPRRLSGNRFLDYIFWSRGQEITAWGYPYEAQKQMAALLPEPMVRARLEATATKLDLADDVPCRTLAATAKTALASQPAPPLDRLRALLLQSLTAFYDREYNSYAELVSWQNKASWLVGCGLLLIVALTNAFPNHGVLFLVGAAGGLLSRLSRSLNRKDAPTDYGASWTTLFLSPVAGALAAWAGILVANLAVQLGILSQALDVSWEKVLTPATLAVALAFGFSERLLDSVFSKLDEKALKDSATGSRAPSTGAGAFSIVNPGVIPATAGQAGNLRLQSIGATGNVTWTLVQPAPAAITITQDGLLAWNLPAGPDVNVSVQASDAGSHATAMRQLTLHIT